MCGLIYPETSPSQPSCLVQEAEQQMVEIWVVSQHALEDLRLPLVSVLNDEAMCSVSRLKNLAAKLCNGRGVNLISGQ